MHCIGKERTSIALTSRNGGSKQSINDDDEPIPNTGFGTGSLSMYSSRGFTKIVYTKFILLLYKVYTFIQRFIVYIGGTDLHSRQSFTKYK